MTFPVQSAGYLSRLGPGEESRRLTKNAAVYEHNLSV